MALAGLEQRCSHGDSRACYRAQPLHLPSLGIPALHYLLQRLPARIMGDRTGADGGPKFPSRIAHAVSCSVPLRQIPR